MRYVGVWKHLSELIDNAEESRVSDEMYVILVGARTLAWFTTPQKGQTGTQHTGWLCLEDLYHSRELRTMLVLDNQQMDEGMVCNKEERTCLL